MEFIDGLLWGLHMYVSVVRYVCMYVCMAIDDIYDEVYQ
jgi:hypothetical protein